MNRMDNNVLFNAKIATLPIKKFVSSVILATLDNYLLAANAFLDIMIMMEKPKNAKNVLNFVSHGKKNSLFY